MLYLIGVGALTLAWLKYIEILQKTILMGSLLYHGVTVCVTSYNPEAMSAGVLYSRSATHAKQVKG